MKDAYSFDKDESGLKISYQKMLDAYFKIFNRCGLDTRMVESDTGAMGGKAAHEFMVMVETEGGENIIFYCDQCDYAANMEKATSLETESPADEENEKPPIRDLGGCPAVPNFDHAGQLDAVQPDHSLRRQLIGLRELLSDDRQYPPTLAALLAGPLLQWPCVDRVSGGGPWHGRSGGQLRGWRRCHRHRE